MFHPLIAPPTELKDADLEQKILDLSKKYFIAARMGQGGVCDQLSMALDMYKQEQGRRQRESTKTLVKNQDKDLDDLINVQ
jgi:hypothetical protein